MSSNWKGWEAVAMHAGLRLRGATTLDLEILVLLVMHHNCTRPRNTLLHSTDLSPELHH